MKEDNLAKERRKYNDTFKREAVEHWLQSGQSAETVGQRGGSQMQNTPRPSFWKVCVKLGVLICWSFLAFNGVVVVCFKYIF